MGASGGEIEVRAADWGLTGGWGGRGGWRWVECPRGSGHLRLWPSVGDHAQARFCIRRWPGVGVQARRFAFVGGRSARQALPSL